jgi:DNA-damage-inducible protein D
MFDLAQFEDAGHENGIRYWLAHEFMDALGYESWASFQNVIRRAQASCLQLGIDTDDAFIRCELDDGTKSYKLTRFACYLVAMQADGKKPEVAKAQITLAALAEALVETQIADQGLARLEERGKLSAAEKHLSGAAKSAGLTTGLDYGIFRDAGFRGMYDMSLAQLKDYKGAPGKKTLYDFMGLTELAANTFRVTQTAERMKRGKVRGRDQAASTAHEVGREVRGIMVKSSGVLPEELELEGPITEVKKQIKATHRKMLKHDAPKKKASKKKRSKKKQG